MGNFWKSTKLNTIILSCTISVFTLNTITPIHAAPQPGISLNDIGFAIRIEKLIEKIKKYREKKDSNKLIEVMFDIKSEVEGYTGQKINLEKSLDQVERDVKAKGGKVDKRVMNKIKKNFKNHEKKCNHKASYMANCIEFNLPYIAEEEHILFQNELLMAKHSHGKDKEKDDEICVPLRVTIGVTVTLCGIFLLFVPIPICKKYASYVIEAGMAFLVDEGITQYEEKDKKDKK